MGDGDSEPADDDEARSLELLCLRRLVFLSRFLLFLLRFLSRFLRRARFLRRRSADDCDVDELLLSLSLPLSPFPSPPLLLSEAEEAAAPLSEPSDAEDAAAFLRDLFFFLRFFFFFLERFLFERPESLSSLSSSDPDDTGLAPISWVTSTFFRFLDEALTLRRSMSLR